MIDKQKLQAPLPFMWREQSKKNGWATCVAYIDARQVAELLDDVVGIENWQTDYKQIGDVLYCGIGINIIGRGGTITSAATGEVVSSIAPQWVWKWDCGTESNTEKEKGAASDAFKRAAVKWGIGRFLYNVPTMRVPTMDHNGKEYVKNENTGKPIYTKEDLTEYINGRKVGTRKPAAKASPATTAHEPAESFAGQSKQVKGGFVGQTQPQIHTSKAPSLDAARAEPTGAQIDAMLKAISEGKWKDVENALPKYTLSAGNKETITKAINDAKTAAIKAAIPTKQ